MTNYAGTVNVSGSLTDSLGESATFSGSLGINLSANLNSAGSGTATETVNGSISYRYTSASYTGGGTIPFNFSTPGFAFQFGNFAENQVIPVSLLGAEFGIRLNGTVSINQTTISESLTATVSGTYAGATFSGTVFGSGSLTAAPITIESFGVTRLVLVGDQYFMRDGSGNGPSLKVLDNPVVAGQFGAVAPIGAEQTATGYEVAWKVTGANLYTVWNTDSNGNYTSSATGVVSGNDPTLEALEISFQQDLNGDGQIGAPATTIEAFGETRLVLLGDQYFMRDSSGSGPSLKVQGKPVVVGQFGPVALIGAEQTASGYEVAWKVTGANLYTVWNTDSTGNYTSSAIGVVSGDDPSLEKLEASFHQDLNGDGQIVIESFGTTSLVQVGNQYFLRDSGGNGPSVKYSDSPINAGSFGGWAPIGGEQTAGGYEVAWKMTGADEYVVWNTDANGNFTSFATGAVPGNDPSLEALEISFHQDLNGDGQIGPPTTVIESFGVTSLVQVGNQYFLRDSGGNGPSLKVQGNAVVAGQYGPVAPIGAEQTASGYEVAWKVTGFDLYTVWNTGGNGNYTGSATGVVPGADFTLEVLETSFHQDLNGDGRLSTTVTTGTSGGDTVDLSTSSQATTINLDGDTASASSGLNAPSLTFVGTPDAITLGSAAATIQYALAASSGIETIANFQLGQDELNIDLLGQAASVLRTYDTTVTGVHAIAIASSADSAHGVVLLNVPASQTAADLLTNHTIFSGGHALIG